MFLKIFPGDNLLSIVEGLEGDCEFDSSDFSGILRATSLAELLRALLAFAVANVSDGEL
jgi:hypothetical protein